ncbi:Hypothetical predicted protein [Mytilus galloprovincialis]|uniref:BTB domain-containing protein n=1 Tax=Mytilus galloprovincialis TaxID=29158 RepID=A0A8B6BMT6_MYTGA|nr:Hypothetical predicted protein [Mytilus galloprovincialis]
MEGTLHVNKEQLMAASPVFHKMLTANFKEKKDQVINLPDKSAIAFAHFLRHTLPGFDGMEMTETVAHLIVPIAHEYQCTETLSKVDLKLVNCCNTTIRLKTEQLLEYILEAELYDLTNLLNNCIEKAPRRKFTAFVENPQFQKISPGTKDKICLMRWKNVDRIINEIPVYTISQEKFTAMRNKFTDYMEG